MVFMVDMQKHEAAIIWRAKAGDRKKDDKQAQTRKGCGLVVRQTTRNADKCREYTDTHTPAFS